MKRTAGTLIVLAALGGCSSVNQGPDVGETAYSDGRTVPVPAAVQAQWRQHDQPPAPYPYGGGASMSRSATPNSYASAGAIARPAAETASVQPLPRSAATPSSTGALACATPSGSGYGYSQIDRTPKRVAVPDLDASHDPVVSDPLGKNALLLPPKDFNKLPVITSTAPPVVSTAAKESARDLPSGTEHSSSLLSLKEQAVLPAPGSIATVGLDSPHPAGPAVRMINSKRITLNFEVKDVGPSGLAGVDLYYTQDAKTWKKGDAPPQTKSPYIIEVNDEGLYGFSLVAHNGVGMGKEPPQTGDQPQVWVEVDQTKPVVRLQGIEEAFGGKNQSLVVRWTASDKNLGPKPITILYAEKADGPWQTIAANVENNGKYSWVIPSSGIPARFFVRVEATDLVGNIAGAQTPTPISVDLSLPTVSILGVEPGK